MRVTYSIWEVTGFNAQWELCVPHSSRDERFIFLADY